MTPCPRCRAPVDLQARFCSECGSWVVHAPKLTSELMVLPTGATFPASSLDPHTSSEPSFDKIASATMPTPTTPNAAPPYPEPVGPPPSVLSAIRVPQSDRPPPLAPGPRPGATMVRTLDTGRPPAPPPGSAMPEPEFTAVSRAPKTMVDEHPPATTSRSMGRTPRPLGGFLVSFQYEKLGTFWPLAIGENLVGRSNARPDIDVGIADTTVSSEQAIIEVTPPTATVEDRGSKNGTRVNGRTVQSGAKIPLAHGDRVRFGSFETILVMVPYSAGT